MADTLFKDGFNETGNWEYIADDVMGGVSKGKVQFRKVDGENHAILSGEVSTKNNGGFIQIRRDLNGINLETAKAIKIIAKGNNQKYFLHIRTNRMFLPWQYYHAEFTVNESFNEYVIPISSFNKSGYFIPGKINSKNIRILPSMRFEYYLTLLENCKFIIGALSLASLTENLP